MMQTFNHQKINPEDHKKILPMVFEKLLNTENYIYQLLKNRKKCIILSSTQNHFFM